MIVLREMKIENVIHFKSRDDKNVEKEVRFGEGDLIKVRFNKGVYSYEQVCIIEEICTADYGLIDNSNYIHDAILKVSEEFGFDRGLEREIFCSNIIDIDVLASKYNPVTLKGKTNGEKLKDLFENVLSDEEKESFLVFINKGEEPDYSDPDIDESVDGNPSEDAHVTEDEIVTEPTSLPDTTITDSSSNSNEPTVESQPDVIETPSTELEV